MARLGYKSSLFQINVISVCWYRYLTGSWVKKYLWAAQSTFKSIMINFGQKSQGKATKVHLYCVVRQMLALPSLIASHKCDQLLFVSNGIY